MSSVASGSRGRRLGFRGLRREVLGQLGEALPRPPRLLGQPLLRARVGPAQLRVEVSRTAATGALQGGVDQGGGVPLQLLEGDVELALLLGAEHAVVGMCELPQRAEPEMPQVLGGELRGQVSARQSVAGAFSWGHAAILAGRAPAQAPLEASSTVSSAVGATSSRSSGIGCPLRTERP